MSLKIVFMGTPDFAVPVLEALQSLKWPIAGVYTAPARPAGRSRRVRFSPIKRYALEAGLLVQQPENFRSSYERDRLLELGPDVLVVAAYGKLLPEKILQVASKGAVNVHPSLLPMYRGATPVPAAILAGDDYTGVSIMLLDEGMDTGPILAQKKVPIEKSDTSSLLITRLFKEGSMLLQEALPLYMEGRIEPRDQDYSYAFVTNRLTKEDGNIDWSKPAKYIERQIRAYRPWPGSFTHWEGRKLEILSAQARTSTTLGDVGQIVAAPDGGPPGVITTEGELVLLELKLEGKQNSGIAEFLRGYPSLVEARLG